MAGSLGQAIFEISLDTGGMKAEFDHAKKLAASAGKQIRSEFELDKKRSIKGLDDRIKTLKKEQEGVEGLAGRYDQLEKEIKDVVKVRNKLASSKFEGPKAGSLGALDAREQSLRKEIRQVEIGSKKYKALAVQIRKASGARAKADKAISGQGFGIGKQLAGVAAAAVSIGALTAGLSGAIGKALELETATKVLANTLGAGGAAEALDFTGKLASELGVNFLQTSQNFGKFTAAATAAKVPLDQQKELFKETSKAAVRYGLSNEQISGTFQALQQMASKGVVSMEELRQQLGERMPVAFAAAADGLGITTQELDSLVSSGKLAATDFFPAFTKGLKNLAQGANTTKTSAQKLQIFTNNWQDLQIAVGKTVLPAIVKIAEGLGEAFKWAADNLSTLIAVAAGLGAAVIAFNAVALSTMAAAAAQAALAAAAAVAQVILNPANAMKVAAAMAIGAGVALGLKVALDEATKSQTTLGDATADSTTKQNALKAAADQARQKRIDGINAIAFAQEGLLQFDVISLQRQEARLGNYAKEVGLIQQIAAVRSDAALNRSDTIKGLLGQEMAQAQKLAKTEIQRKQIALEFGKKIFNQTVREFDLKARALVTEQEAQRTSLQFEQQKEAAAGRRAEREAKIAEIQAQQQFDIAGTDENQRKLRLAQANLNLILQQNTETQNLGRLQLGLLSAQQAAGRDQLAQERLLALNGQQQFATKAQQAVIQKNVNEMLRGQAQQVSAAAVSASNFRSQLEGAAHARGNLSTAFQAQVNTHLDGSQHFSQMNSTLDTIAENTSRETQFTVEVNVDPGSGTANSSVRGTG